MLYHIRMRAEYREEPCRTALNPVRGMPFNWSLNPYMGCVHRCTFCYVRSFELRADRPWDERYGASIRVKTNVASVLRAELARRAWRRETVAIGAATDPYQPAEGHYRLRAVRMLAEAGVRVSVLAAPLIPGLSDTGRSLDEVVRAARDAGACGVSAGLLHLQPGTREHFLSTLSRVWPEEAGRLRALFADRVYLPTGRQRAVASRLAAIGERVPRRAGLPPIVRPSAEAEPPVFARQLGLAL